MSCWFVALHGCTSNHFSWWWTHILLPCRAPLQPSLAERNPSTGASNGMRGRRPAKLIHAEAETMLWMQWGCTRKVFVGCVAWVCVREPLHCDRLGICNIDMVRLLGLQFIG